MNQNLGRVLEISLVLIALYLILANSFGFSQILKAGLGGYVDSVKALQGR